MRRSKIQPSQLFSGRQEAIVRQAYANGLTAGKMGAVTNPHPKGTAEYEAWANGYAAGKRGRYGNRTRGATNES